MELKAKALLVNVNPRNKKFGSKVVDHMIENHDDM